MDPYLEEELLFKAYIISEQIQSKKIVKIVDCIVPDFETACYYARRAPEIWEYTVPEKRAKFCLTPRAHLLHAAREWVKQTIKKRIERDA